MEAAIMAMRVALLILVTGVFAALWAGDHPQQVAGKTHPARKADDFRPVSPQRSSESLTRYSSEPHHSAGSILLATSNLSNVPLPEGIAAGTYLVAAQTGRTQVRVIRTDDRDDSEKSIPNHYTIEMSGARWHFIRIDPSLNDRIASDAAPTSIR